MDAVDTLERATNVLQRKLGGAALMQTKVNRKELLLLSFLSPPPIIQPARQIMKSSQFS